MHMSPVNVTGSHIMYNGWTSLSDSDDTLGKEEFARLQILNGSEWEYEIEDRNEPTVAVANIIDWNQNDISVQTGQASLSGTTLTVSPPTDVIRNQTILLVTHIPSNDEFNDEPDDAGLLAFLDGSVPPDIIFERTSGVDLPLEINWIICQCCFCCSTYSKSCCIFNMKSFQSFCYLISSRCIITYCNK